jgi:hypothetical protein
MEKILVIVMGGSTMTFFPDLVIRTNGFVSVYCSAIKAETLALMPPPPMPMKIMEMRRPGSAKPASINEGSDVTERIARPMM